MFTISLILVQALHAPNEICYEVMNKAYESGQRSCHKLEDNKSVGQSLAPKGCLLCIWSVLNMDNTKARVSLQDGLPLYIHMMPP